jgi:hypothetical protein
MLYKLQELIATGETLDVGPDDESKLDRFNLWVKCCERILKDFFGDKEASDFSGSGSSISIPFRPDFGWKLAEMKKQLKSKLNVLRAHEYALK